MKKIVMAAVEQETIIIWSRAEDSSKRCPKCGESKPREQFARMSCASDGLRVWCRSCCNTAGKIRRSANPEKYRRLSLEYRLKHPQVCIARETRYREDTKMKTLTHYGNGKCACVACGEERLPCLGLDHIQGDGADEFRRLKRRGNGLYSYLRTRDFPLGYQTMCMNCNWMKRHEMGESRGMQYRATAGKSTPKIKGVVETHTPAKKPARNTAAV